MGWANLHRVAANWQIAYDPPMAIELPADYYLANFHELIDFVADSYADLLTAEEADFHATFHALEQNAQKLFVRMLIRKGNLFRASKLQYREIGDTESAAERLADLGFIAIDPAMAAHDIIGLYSRDEWLAILQQNAIAVKPLKKLRRDAFDSAVLKFFSAHPLPTIAEPIYLIARPEIFEIFKLLFFGNLHQDLTEFVLRDLGLQQYEHIRIDHSTRLFQDRAQLNRHLAYYAALDGLEAALAGDAQVITAFYAGLPEAHNDDPVLVRRISRVSFHLARQLERLQQFDEALAIYRQIHTADARERCARILRRQENVAASLALCKTIFNAPLTEAESNFAANFGYRTAKKYGGDWPPPDKYHPPSDVIVLPPCDSVELGAAEYFSSRGECHYVENALFCSVFGLHYWDIIFAPVRGAFTHPFQAGPHDLYEPTFVESRQALFDTLQKQCETVEWLQTQVMEKWRGKWQKVSPFVHWHTVNEKLLLLAFDRIPLPHWQAIFERLWADLRGHHNGFPDLIFFPQKGSYELIEVKGPGDRLQKNQQLWMQYFHRHHIAHKVVNVEWR